MWTVEHRRVYRRATTGRALSSCRAAGWSSAPSPAFGRNRRPAKHFENLAVTLATFVTLASIQLALGRLARAKAVTQQTTVGKCAMTKVGKSDGEGTLAGTRGNDKVAPKAVLGSAAPESSSSSQPNCCCVSYTRRSNLLSGHGLPRQRIPLLVRVLERPS